MSKVVRVKGVITTCDLEKSLLGLITGEDGQELKYFRKSFLDWDGNFDNPPEVGQKVTYEVQLSHPHGHIAGQIRREN
ncbi:hypothetical protein [Pseudomonas sp. S2_C03]